MMSPESAAKRRGPARFGLVLVLIVLALFAPSTARTAEPEDHTALEEEIAEAIDRGTRFLYAALADERFPTGGTSSAYPLGFRALPAYALLESGSSTQAPRVKKLFDDMERVKWKRTYSVAIYTMALDAHHRRVMAESKGLSESERSRAKQKLQRRLRKAIQWIERVRSAPRGIWGYENARGKNPVDVWMDFSNTQFAVLALQVGIVNDVKVSTKVLQEIARSHSLNATPRGDWIGEIYCDGAGWWIDSGTSPYGDDAGDDGGNTRVIPRDTPVIFGPGGFSLRTGPIDWPYRPHWGDRMARETPRFSMVAAATSSLMVVREGLAAQGKLGDEARQDLDRLIAGGVVALHDGFSSLAPRQRSSLFRNYYYDLYSFEKAMDLGGITRLGGIDWYHTQARALLAHQRRDGGWGSTRRRDDEFDIVSTSFALLFLNRATKNLRVVPPPPIFTGDGDSGPSALRQGWVYLPSRGGRVALSELFGRLTNARTSDTIELARETIAAAPPRELPELLPHLVRAYEGLNDSVDRFVDEQMQAIGGLRGSVGLAAVESWLAEWRSINEWADARATDRVAEIGRYLSARKSTAPMRRTAIRALSQIASLDGGIHLLAALEDGDREVRVRAARALERLTLRRANFDADAPDRAAAAAGWRETWGAAESDLRFRVAWDRLRDALEASSDADERALLRGQIVALGPRALPAIESILARDRFAFDWVLIRAELTGEEQGLRR